MTSARGPWHWLRPPGPVAPGLRIGLLGGSFNPAHEGHLYLSEVALKRLGLDYVWWLVTPQNPLKSPIGLAPIADRLRAAQRVARHPRVIATDIERVLGTRYSIDTLEALQRRFPLVEFVWLMGSDSLLLFRRWRRWREIASRVPIAVIQRPGTVLACLSAAPMQHAALRRAIRVIDGRRNMQSSTAIRAKAFDSEALVRAIPPC
ncbi:MAG TPA: nicotinate (nicotinamide) nucleotide adenylyltransferase [Rhizomicrobium sp.]|nr:nicotinate (nicotinamide) nucleotide adenylyltransferase [Rhizomicrobium sp.]